MQLFVQHVDSGHNTPQLTHLTSDYRDHCRDRGRLDFNNLQFYNTIFIIFSGEDENSELVLLIIGLRKWQRSTGRLGEWFRHHQLGFRYLKHHCDVTRIFYFFPQSG